MGSVYWVKYGIKNVKPFYTVQLANDWLLLHLFFSEQIYLKLVQQIKLFLSHVLQQIYKGLKILQLHITKFSALACRY